MNSGTAEDTRNSLQGLKSCHASSSHRPIYHHLLGTFCRLKTRIACRLTSANFEPMANIRVPIVSIPESLTDIKRSIFSPAPNFKCFASKAVVPSFWPVDRDIFNIPRSLLPSTLRPSKTPVHGVEGLVSRTLTTVQKLGADTRP